MAVTDSAVHPLMIHPANRRAFIKRATLFSFGVAATAVRARAQAPKSPGEKLVVGVMGLSRGAAHVRALNQLSNVEVAYLCEVDETRAAAVQKNVFGTAAKPARVA